MTLAELTVSSFTEADSDEFGPELGITKITRIQFKRSCVALTVESSLPPEELASRTKPIGFTSTKIITGHSSPHEVREASAS